MGKIRKKKTKELPPVSTASLPDIVFMLLFFFMVTTTMREVTLMVKVAKPKATEVQKIDRKDLTAYIYVGTPLDDRFGKEPRIQLDDQLGTLADVQTFVATKREELGESDRPKFIVSIKADSDVKMGIITDLKQELRKAEALKIMYSTEARKSAEDIFDK